MKTTGIHIGKLIEEKVDELGLSVSEFARRINRSSQSIYHIFKSASVDTELLAKVNKALKHDFFAYYTSGPTAPVGKKKQPRISISIEVEGLAEQEKILKLIGLSLK